MPIVFTRQRNDDVADPSTPFLNNAYLKLMVNLKPLNTSVHDVLFVGKYIADKNITYNNFSTTSYYNYPTVVVLQNTDVNANVVAWDKIVVGPNVTFNPPAGQTISLTAGQEIVVQPNVSIPFEKVTLKMGLPFECTNYVIPASEAVINSFCTSSVYTDKHKFPNSISKDSINTGIEVIQINGNQANMDEMLKILPNPTNGATIVRYQVQSEGSVKIFISNPLGNEVKPLIQTSNHQVGLFDINFDSSQFTVGVYYCTIQFPTESKTIKFTVVK